MAENYKVGVQIELKLPSQSNITKIINSLNDSLKEKVNVDINTGSIENKVKKVKQEVDELKKSLDSISKGNFTKQSITFVDGKAVKAVTDYTDAIGKLRKEIQAAGKETVTVKTTDNTKILKTQQEIENALLQTEINRRKEIEKLTQAQAKVSNKAMDNAYLNRLKEEKKASEDLLKIQQQLLLLQGGQGITGSAQMQANLLSKRYTGLINETELNNWVNKVNQLTPSTANLSFEIKKLNSEFQKIKMDSMINGMDLANKSAMSFGQVLTQIIEKFSLWIGVSTLVMGALHKLTDSFDYMLESTKLFTNLQMEMTRSNLNFSEIMTTANQFAGAMSSTSSEVMRAISVFGTYNSTLEQVYQRSQAAVIMANITGESILKVSDDLMAAQTQFRLSSDQLMGVVDAYTSVARNLQVDFPKAVAELGSGIRYVGAVATEAKIPLQDLIAMEGTLIDVTRRSGSQIS